MRLLLLVPIAGGLCWCTPGERPELRIQRVSSAPKLSDLTTPGINPPGTKVTGFRQWQPADGEPASHPTSAYISYDERNLYVGFVCSDQSGQTRSHLSPRDDITKDDYVGVALDTFQDHQRFYRFSSNPLGVQQDAISTEGQDDDLSFDTVWNSEGRLTLDGYAVLITIPFRSLRFPRKQIQQWGVAFYRNIVRYNELSYWPQVSQKMEGFAQQFASLEGMEAVSPAHNWQMTPYFFLGSNRFLETNDPPGFRTAHEFRGGLDTKIVLHNALTIDVTLNPDASQIETDQPQVTINQRYQVYFPEKRPFFTENAAFLQTPENLFYSRRIVDPEFGARLTGKLGSWKLGALLAEDRTPGQTVAPDDPYYDRHARIWAGNITREFASQSHIGILATDYESGPNTNRVLSLDTRIKPSDNWVVLGQAIYSQTRIAGNAPATGTDYLAEASRTGLHFNYDAQYIDRSPGLQALLGFIPRVDIRQFSHSGDYRWHPARWWLKTIELYGGMNAAWDHRNRQQDLASTSVLQVEWVRRSYFGITRVAAFERYLELNFRKDRTDVSYYVERLRWLALLASYSFGTNINYYAATGLAPFLGNMREGRVDITLRPGARLRVREIWLHSGLETRDPRHENIFQSEKFRTQVNYQFTRSLALRAIVDRNIVLPNPALVSSDNPRLINLDLLLTYQLHPGTALFMGYGDTRENLAFLPGGSPPLYRTAGPAMVTGRQYFMKVSYVLPF